MKQSIMVELLGYAETSNLCMPGAREFRQAGETSTEHS